MLSLGCQKAQIIMLQNAIAERDPSGYKPVSYFEQQRSESEEVLRGGSTQFIPCELPDMDLAEYTGMSSAHFPQICHIQPPTH